MFKGAKKGERDRENVYGKGTERGGNKRDKIIGSSLAPLLPRSMGKFNTI